MRALSKQRLSKMHAMLDKELENEQDTISNPSSVLSNGRKQKGNFSHLRYTSNLDLDDDLEENTKKSIKQRTKQVSRERQSLFKKSLQKNQKAKLQLIQQSRKQYGGLSSSEEQSLQKQSKTSLRGSRKNEINQLEKKLMDLEKKMENINISSSQQDDQQHPTKIQEKYVPKTVSINKSNSKKQLYALKLQQNGIEAKGQFQSEAIESPRQATGRFSANIKNQETNKREKIDFKSNLPLSHRKNTASEDDQQNSDEEFQMKYDKFVKVTRENINPAKQVKQYPKQDSSEEQDSEDEKQKRPFHNKSISQQIQRLSIMNKESTAMTNIKSNLSKNKPIENSSKKSLSRQHKININTIPIQPERKLTLQHQSLEPKYQLQTSKNKSKSKKSIKLPKKSLSKDKTLSFKNTNRHQKEHSTSKKKIQRNYTNLDNSFRSQNSAKSKKSMKSLRSVGSNKSLSRKQANEIGKVQNLEEKKYLKKVQNLQKQLEHYKRLSKRYESQISDYKLLQIQYKKLQTQFKKSQQIRVQQKKIIQNFRNKALNG